MKIKVLKQTDNELKIEIEGSGHGVCNLLQKKLLENERVDQAGYDVPHPLASNPVIYIRTVGNVTPKEILLEAVAEARESNQSFCKALEETIKS